MAKKTPPTGTITVLQAKEKEEYYKLKFYSFLNSLMGKEYPGYDGAVRDIWFDLNQLKRYIEYVEDYASDKAYSNLGLRVYLGAEDKPGQDGMIYPRQTVFFVPTAKVPDTSGFVNKNLTGVERLNFGVGGIPDSTDSDMGIN